jgi:hypothetical protein
VLHLQEAATPRKFQRRCDISFLVGYSSKSKAYRVFNHATGLVEETYDVKFDEPLREVMKNMSVGDIKPKYNEDDVQVINPPSSSSV